MFFLLRVAFWLSIVLVFLPSGDYRPKDQAQIGAAEAVNAASAAVSDLSGFCGRQPDACQVGGQAVIAFGQRAQAGARYLFDVLHDRLAPSTTGSIGAGTSSSQSTLKPSDLEPEWRAPLPPRDPRHPA